MKHAVQLQSLEVAVVASKYSDEPFPVIVESHYYHDITRGGSRQI